ncbi:sensor histidine kinase [Nocardioides ochotonae]|uniref:sensor histidine kinase n=1 Tax=Nocardioides ochotonae TaxID=2685869 RepID=UPI00140A8A40|nr:HAMP domain-containing sensor histidine kinase [Nocardioides ochotonae]
MLLAVPLVVIEATTSRGTFDELAVASSLVFAPALVVSALFLYLHWRITDSQPVAWLTACTIVIAAHVLVLAALHLGGAGTGQDAWVLATDLIVVSIVAITLGFSETVPVFADPAAFGLGVGVALAGAHVAVAEIGWELPLSTTGRIIGAIALGLLSLPIVAGLARMPLPRWAALRLQLGLLLFIVSLTVGRLEAVPVAAPIIGLVSGFVATATVCSASFALLCAAIGDDLRAIADLRRSLRAIENRARSDRAQLHEVKGTIAGIASAVELLTGDYGYEAAPAVATSGTAGPTLRSKASLGHMVAKETARLTRLLQKPPVEGASEVDVDEILAPLVMAHRAQGRTVRWAPSGLRCRAVPDHLSEVVNILLANAAAHAPGSTVEIGASLAQDRVLIRVCDDGPGVLPDLADSIFEWGARRPESAGSGIGLNIAQTLLDADGGCLRLDRTYRDGASFVIGLELAREESDVA